MGLDVAPRVPRRLTLDLESPHGTLAGGRAGGSMSAMAVTGWDPGMVAIAVLMLASGLILSTGPSDGMEVPG